MAGEELSQANEGPHDFDVDVDGPLAVEDAGEHGDALFGENPRSGSPASPIQT